MYKLSAPSKSGYVEHFEHLSDAQWRASELIGVSVADMVEIDSPDGGTTYCYATREEADADRDGADAVQYSGVI